MTISEVSKKFDLTADTLRYYERVGVIPPVRRTKSGVRDYSEEDCGWVELAGCMRGAGLPLPALAEYVRLSQNTMERLEYKISCYDRAMETGRLVWD